MRSQKVRDSYDGVIRWRFQAERSPETTALGSSVTCRHEVGASSLLSVGFLPTPGVSLQRGTVPPPLDRQLPVLMTLALKLWHRESRRAADHLRTCLLLQGRAHLFRSSQPSHSNTSVLPNFWRNSSDAHLPTDHSCYSCPALEPAFSGSLLAPGQSVDGFSTCTHFLQQHQPRAKCESHTCNLKFLLVMLKKKNE